MSDACPDGHTSRFASIDPESSPAHTAFSSMSFSAPVTPCFSRTALATSALADEPSHGLTAIVTEPPHLSPEPEPESDETPDLLPLLLPHAASTNTAAATVATSHRLLRIMSLSPWSVSVIRHPYGHGHPTLGCCGRGPRP